MPMMVVLAQPEDIPIARRIARCTENTVVIGLYCFVIQNTCSVAVLVTLKTFARCIIAEFTLVILTLTCHTVACRFWNTCFVAWTKACFIAFMRTALGTFT